MTVRSRGSAPPKMKTKRGTWKVTLAVVAGAILAGAIVSACGRATTSGGRVEAGAGEGVKAPLSDVSITSCAMSSDQSVGPVAKLKITNSSSERSNYKVQIAFLPKGGGTQFDTAYVSVGGVAPGQMGEEAEATSLKPEAKEQAKAGMTCKVLDVTRYAS